MHQSPHVGVPQVGLCKALHSSLQAYRLDNQDIRSVVLFQLLEQFVKRLVLQKHSLLRGI
jgi:hypothetical protein